MFGNISSGIFWQDIIGMGASTAVFGFMGCMIGVVLKQKHGTRNELFWVLILPVSVKYTYAIVAQFFGGGDYIAHGSGWLLGLFYIMIFLPELHQKGAWTSEGWKKTLFWGSLYFVGAFNLLQLVYYFFFTSPALGSWTC